MVDWLTYWLTDWLREWQVNEGEGQSEKLHGSMHNFNPLAVCALHNKAYSGFEKYAFLLLANLDPRPQIWTTNCGKQCGRNMQMRILVKTSLEICIILRVAKSVSPLESKMIQAYESKRVLVYLIFDYPRLVSWFAQHTHIVGCVCLA